MNSVCGMDVEIRRVFFLHLCHNIHTQADRPRFTIETKMSYANTYTHHLVDLIRNPRKKKNRRSKNTAHERMHSTIITWRFKWCIQQWWYTAYEYIEYNVNGMTSHVHSHCEVIVRRTQRENGERVQRDTQKIDNPAQLRSSANRIFAINRVHNSFIHISNVHCII